MQMDFKKFENKASPLAPKLEQILNDLYLKIPTLTFEAYSKKWRFAETDEEGRIEMGVSKAIVFNGYEPVGSVEVNEEEDADGKFVIYSIESDRIRLARSRRGNRSAKSTRHIKNAIKLGVEMFTKTPNDKWAKKFYDEMVSEITSVKRHAGYEVERALGRCQEEVLAYIVDVARNGAMPLQNDILSKLPDNWQSIGDTMTICRNVASSAENLYGVMIRIEKDGTLHMLDLSTNEVTEHTSTYDLPTNYQEKITMLKIVDPTQAIDHVGIRFDTEIKGVTVQDFYLVGGETVTTC